MQRIEIKDPETFRNNIRSKINLILENEKFSRNLEKGVFNYALKEASTRKIGAKQWSNHYFVQIYLDHMRSVFANLKNPSLVEQIKNETIKAQDVPFMTHQELRPDKWNDLIDAKMKRDKYKFEVNLEASTDTFTCRKCKSKKCTYVQVQTRSADEPMTTFVSCLECGCRWKC